MAKVNITLSGPIEVNSLISAATRLEKQFMNKFPEPPTKTSKGKHAKQPVRAGKTSRGKMVQYLTGGHSKYYRVLKLMADVKKTLIELQGKANYVNVEEPPSNVVPMKRKRRKRA